MYNQFKAERAGIHAVGRTLAHIRNDLKQAIQWCIQGDFFPRFFYPTATRCKYKFIVTSRLQKYQCTKENLFGNRATTGPTGGPNSAPRTPEFQDTGRGEGHWSIYLSFNLN